MAKADLAKFSKDAGLCVECSSGLKSSVDIRLEISTRCSEYLIEIYDEIVGQQLLPRRKARMTTAATRSCPGARARVGATVSRAVESAWESIEHGASNICRIVCRIVSVGRHDRSLVAAKAVGLWGCDGLHGAPT